MNIQTFFVKKLWTYFILVLVSLTHIYAQNNPPVVEDVTAIADTQNHVVEITYDLSDTEEDSIQISL